jgi:CRISPR-associated protein Cas1
MRQYRAALDEDRTLEIARWLVRQKIEGQEKWMADRAENAVPTGDREVLARCRKDLPTAETRERLMGLEGAAAAAYFRTVSAALPPRWNFSGRNRRPPRDPVNSLLSLTYVLAGSEISRILRDRGLDPFVGFLHGLQDGRESLMLDVLEPLRPMLDRFVFSLLDSTVTPEDFTRSPRDGCRLQRNGRTRFYGAWADGEGVPALKTAGEAVADAVLDRC